MTSKKLEENLASLTNKLGLENISDSLYFPKYFEIETIRACNANCPSCTIYEWNDKNNKMDDEVFDKIAKEISKYNQWVNRVCLSRNGEPLLDKTLIKKIQTLKDYGIKEVSFSTNASLLNKEKSIELIESGLDDIRFSIDGVTKKTFEYLRKPLNFEKVVGNCLNFIKLRNERGKKPIVQIRMVLQKENYNEEEKWKNYWLSKVSENDIVSSKPMHSWGAQLKGYEGNITKETKKYLKIPCISPFSTMIIHFDGKVPICGCDYNNKILLGDVNKSSIEKIWQSENFNKIRRLHSSGKRNEIPLCNGCNIWDMEQKKKYNINEESL